MTSFSEILPPLPLPGKLHMNRSHFQIIYMGVLV